MWEPVEGSSQGRQPSPWECCKLTAITGKQSINNTGGWVWAKGHHRTVTLESYQGHRDTRPLGLWRHTDTGHAKVTKEAEALGLSRLSLPPLRSRICRPDTLRQD